MFAVDASLDTMGPDASSFLRRLAIIAIVGIGRRYPTSILMPRRAEGRQ
jgi:hypothetical protein